MPDLKLCSRQDVIDMGLGGDTSAAVALTRSDPTAWNPALLDVPILMASADVEVAAGNRFTLNINADVSTYPFALRKTAALRAVYYAWLTYAKGQAMPPEVKAAWDTTESDLARLRDSKQGAGIVSPPPRRLYGVSDIDLTGGGTVPRMSLAGWSRL